MSGRSRSFRPRAGYLVHMIRPQLPPELDAEIQARWAAARREIGSVRRPAKAKAADDDEHVNDHDDGPPPATSGFVILW